jgi:hypothetical protein
MNQCNKLEINSPVYFRDICLCSRYFEFLFSYSTIFRGTPKDVACKAGWETQLIHSHILRK